MPSKIFPALRPFAQPIELFHENPRNTQVHDERNIGSIAASLLEFGQYQPIVVDDRGMVIIGNGRLQAALSLGWTEIAVLRWSDLTPQQKRALGAIDNRTSELSHPDKGRLAEALGGLDGFDLSAFWSPMELEGLFETPDLSLPGGEDEDTDAGDDEQEEDAPPVDRAEELQREWQTERGQVWEIVGKQTHRVMCGDSTSAEDVARLMDGATPWMMVTDPPYGVKYDPKWRETSVHLQGKAAGALATQTGLVSNDDRAGWEAVYALFAGDVAYVWHASWFIADVKADLEAVGCIPRSLIIWVKAHFVISRGDYHWQHEPCWYAVRRGKPAHRNDDRTQSTVWQIKGMGVFGKTSDASDAKTGHGTQKPVECMARPIRNHVFPAGTCVYDPFLGSGTTLIAAEREGQPCRGMELSPAYVAVILQRAKDAGMTCTLRHP